MEGHVPHRPARWASGGVKKTALVMEEKWGRAAGGARVVFPVEEGGRARGLRWGALRPTTSRRRWAASSIGT
eukprot:scaffold186702_cov13-Tisochrysis_lutea.AAC.1